MIYGVRCETSLCFCSDCSHISNDWLGEDVVIANKLESTGVPGHLHISERTLSMLSGHPYEILPGTQAARDDPLLKRSNIQTFLIASMESNVAISRREMATTFHIVKSNDNDKNRKNYVKQELHKEFEQMPIGVF